MSAAVLALSSHALDMSCSDGAVDALVPRRYLEQRSTVRRSCCSEMKPRPAEAGSMVTASIGGAGGDQPLLALPMVADGPGPAATDVIGSDHAASDNGATTGDEELLPATFVDTVAGDVQCFSESPMRAVLDSASPTHLMGDLSRFRNVRGLVQRWRGVGSSLETCWTGDVSIVLTSTGGARQAVVLRDVAYSPSHGINIVTIGLLRKHSGVEVDFASMMLRDERGGAVTALTEEDCVFWMDFGLLPQSPEPPLISQRYHDDWAYVGAHSYVPGGAIRETAVSPYWDPASGTDACLG